MDILRWLWKKRAPEIDPIQFIKGRERAYRAAGYEPIKILGGVLALHIEAKDGSMHTLNLPTKKEQLPITLFDQDKLVVPFYLEVQGKTNPVLMVKDKP